MDTRGAENGKIVQKLVKIWETIPLCGSIGICGSMPEEGVHIPFHALICAIWGYAIKWVCKNRDYIVDEHFNNLCLMGLCQEVNNAWFTANYQ